MAVQLAGSWFAVPPGQTLGQALAGRDVAAPNGSLVSVGRHRRLSGNAQQGEILLNGAPTALFTVLTAGDVVTAVPGRDTTEPVRAVTVLVRPPNPYGLYVGGAPGVVRVLRGDLSGEVTSRVLLKAPVQGHLRVPGSVVLTFDDGPDPIWTPQVLRLLAAARVHATFCLVGRNAAAYPQLVRAIVAAGNTLCDHTWDHDEQLRTRSPAQIAADIAQGYQAIRQATGGSGPVFFRAPGGNWSGALIAEAARQQMKPLTWTVDTRDWSRPGVVAILKSVTDELRPGGVVLMHDGGGDRSQTVHALAVLLLRLRMQGYRVTLPCCPAATKLRP